MRKLLPPFRMGLGGPLGDGNQWMSWIHVSDLAGLIVHAMESSRLRGPVNAVAPSPVTQTVFAQTLGKTLQRPASFPVPAFALRFILGEMSQLMLSSQKDHRKKRGTPVLIFNSPPWPRRWRKFAVMKITSC